MTTAEMMAAGRTLKAKYRNSDRPHIGNHRILHRDKIDPPEGTLTYAGGKWKASTGQATKKAAPSQSIAPRRKIYKGSVG